jgi:hypothetical protein
MSVCKVNCKVVGQWILLSNRIKVYFWSSVRTLELHELGIWNVVFNLIINMPTVKHFGLSTVINMTEARYCQDAYGKFPVLTLTLLTWRIWWAPNIASRWQIWFNLAFKGLNICIRWSSAYRQVTACCTVIINFTSFTSYSVTNNGKKICCFYPDLGVAVYLHACSIPVLAGNVKRCGQVPLVSIRGSPCLQQSNAAFCVPVLHGTEQRGLTLAVHYIDWRAVLQQQCHTVCVVICRLRDKLKT